MIKYFQIALWHMNRIKLPINIYAVSIYKSYRILNSNVSFSLHAYRLTFTADLVRFAGEQGVIDLSSSPEVEKMKLS